MIRVFTTILLLFYYLILGYAQSCPTLGANLIVNPNFEQGYYGFTSDFGRGINNATLSGCSTQGWLVVTKYDFPNSAAACLQYPSNLSAMYGGPNTATEPNPSHPSNTAIVSLAACDNRTIPDHTTGNGYFLSLDPDAITGRSYWKQTIQVCPNTNYVFSVWVRNISPSCRTPAPYFHFEVGGVAINTSTRYPTCAWVQTSASWNSGAVNGNVQIQMVNDQAGCTSNDVAIDDIFFGVCGGTSLTTDTIIKLCNATPLRLSGNAFGFTPPQYQWQKLNNSTNIWENITGATDSVYRINATTIRDTGSYRLMAAAVGSAINSNCAIASKTIKVNYLPPPLFNLIGTPNSCNRNNGTINTVINNTNNNAPYIFNWSNNARTQNLTNLVNGTYKITITGANTCVSTDSIVIKNIPTPSVSATIKAAICGQANGNVIINAIGGDSIQYSKDNILFTTNNVFNNLIAGQYTFYIKNEACNNSISIRINDSTTLSTTIPTQIIDATCNNNNGVILIQNNNPNTVFKLNNGPYVTTNQFTNLTAGNYRISVKNSDSCVVNGTVTVLNKGTLKITKLDTLPIRCQGNTGVITVSTSGATGTIEYSIDGINYGLSNRLINLSEGIYKVFVKDSFCTLIDSIRIRRDTSNAVKIREITTTPSFCNDKSGVITVKMSANPSIKLMYSLNGTTFSNSDILKGLTTGFYRVYVQDSIGCIVSDTARINNETIALTVDNKIEPPICGANSGSIFITKVNGGKAPYLLSLQDSLNFKIRDSFSNLKAGQYRLFVKDQSNCPATQKLITLKGIECNCQTLMYAPSVFSPNNDMVNDFFVIYPTKSVKQFTNLKIFNRWGNLLYQATDLGTGKDTRNWWDGTTNGVQLANDMFVWMILVEFTDGSKKVCSGDISIIR